MGGRLLKNWLAHPLLDLGDGNQRYKVVAWFHQNDLARQKVISLLSDIADLERLVNRVGSARDASRVDNAAFRSGESAGPEDDSRGESPRLHQG